MSNSNFPKKLQRRKFLANLLFAGGALSVAALQGELLAQPNPEDEGWELPKDWNKPDLKPKPKQTPTPRPTKTPPPPLLGDVSLPNIEGRMRQPRPIPEPRPKP